MDRDSVDCLTTLNFATGWEAPMARGHGRRFSAPDDSQYPAHNYGNTPFRGQYQFRSADQRHAGLAEPPSPSTAVPLLPQPVARRGGARSGLVRSGTGTGNIARTYWHEDLQERRTIPLADALSRGDEESAYSGKERKRDMLRKKWKKVIQAIKDLGDCNHRDEERQERVRSPYVSGGVVGIENMPLRAVV